MQRKNRLVWRFRSAEDIEDVRREVEILHHLGGHPNITQLRGAFEDQVNVNIMSHHPSHRPLL